MPAEVEFFGVRHHSPAGARLVGERIRTSLPAAVLVEGPTDYNPFIDELALPHELPVTITTWAPLVPDAHPSAPEWSARRGAYYPLSAYSPEWVAVRSALELGIPVEFIDLPWRSMADDARAANRFAEPPALQRPALRALLDEVGVDEVDALIDELLEIDPHLGLDDYLVRIHTLGSLLRRDTDEDRRRERFMASRIAEAAERTDGTVLVVCGAAHVDGLRALLAGGFERFPVTPLPDDERYGVALTPTSYRALDALTGYDAGQPNPGFYEALFEDRTAGRTGTAERLLTQIAAGLRGSQQRVSAADLIAVSTTARALASLRGHPEIWRTDLLDGVVGALVKDDAGDDHPLVGRVHDLLRGDRVGRLADGTRRAPLVVELTAELEALGLTPTPAERVERLDLAADDGLRASRLLHSLLALGIPVGKVREVDDSGHERWQVVWTPGFEAALVASARFGGTRVEAVTTCLLAKATDVVDDPRAAADIMLEAALCGVPALGETLQRRTESILDATGDLAGLGTAIRSLLRLHRYDALWRATGRTDVAGLLVAAFGRLALLLERLGPQPDGASLDGEVASVRAGVDVVERCPDLPLAREGWARALATLASDQRQAATLRGAATGARWLTTGLDDQELASSVRLVARPEQLGDFVFGLLRVAREAATRRDDFVLSLDTALMGLSEGEFLEALPGLRRAFSGYPPRERARIAAVLLGEREYDVLCAFAGSDAETRAIASFEGDVLRQVRHFLGAGVL